MDAATAIVAGSLFVVGLIFIPALRELTAALLKKSPALLGTLWTVAKSLMHTVLVHHQNVIANFKPRSAIYFELDRKRTSEDALG